MSGADNFPFAVIISINQKFRPISFKELSLDNPCESRELNTIFPIVHQEFRLETFMDVDNADFVPNGRGFFVSVFVELLPEEIPKLYFHSANESALVVEIDPLAERIVIGLVHHIEQKQIHRDLFQAGGV